jgi:hypothetical protein
MALSTIRTEELARSKRLPSRIALAMPSGIEIR